MKTSTVTVASMMLLGAALAQAETTKFVTLEAAASRTHSNVYEVVKATEPRLNDVKLLNPKNNTPYGTGGEKALHTMITDNHDDNVKHIQTLFEPVHEFLKNHKGDHSVDVYVYGAGGVRLNGGGEKFWGLVKAAIDTFATTDEGKKFNFVAAETRKGVYEAQVALQTSQKLTENKNAIVAWIAGASLQIAYETDDEYLAISYPKLGSVQASEDYTTKLAGPDYAEATAKFRPTSLFSLLNDPVQEMMKELKTGSLSGYQGEIDHPCLMKVETKEEALEMVKFFSTQKSTATALREIAPFKGTGKYEECYNSIANMIDETVTPVKFDAPKTSPVVGMGTLFYNTFNLQSFQIIAKGGLKTVGDLVKASKEACSITFKDALTRFYELEAEALAAGKEKGPISWHGLVELCWASTYSTVVLKHTLGLDDSQLLVGGKADVGKDAALKIARDEL